MKKLITTLLLLLIPVLVCAGEVTKGTYNKWEMHRYVHKNFTAWLPAPPQVEELTQLEGRRGKGTFLDVKSYFPTRDNPDLIFAMHYAQADPRAWEEGRDDKQIAQTILSTMGEEFSNANYYLLIWPNTKKIPSPIAADNCWETNFTIRGFEYKMKVVIGKPHIWVFMSAMYVNETVRFRPFLTKYWESIGIHRGEPVPMLRETEPPPPGLKKKPPEMKQKELMVRLESVREYD